MMAERTIKIISWNLGYWQYRNQHEVAWQYLLDVERPDIALLQEIRPRPSAEQGNMVFQEIRRGWGTAIYLHGKESVRTITLSRYPGHVAAAEVRIRPGESLLVASLHAPIINGRVFPHLDRIFNDIEGIFLGKPSVIGGDFNSARLAEQTWPGYGHGPFFKRIDESWFVDIRKRFHEDEIQTVFRPRQKYPFQDDHILVSKDLADRVISYRVVQDEVTRKVSDHIPVIIEVEI